MQCEVCACSKAIYNCPGCERKSCSVECVKQHKIDFKCDGRRKRIEFVSKEEFGEKELRSDLQFLIEGMNEVERTKRVAQSFEEDYSKNIRKSLLKVGQEAKKNDCIVVFMPETFDKHLRNDSRYDMKNKSILWKVEWTVKENKTKNSKVVNENETLRQIFDLTSSGQDNIVISMELHSKDPVQLLLDQTLKDSLRGKSIVEFPTFQLTIT